MSALETLLDLAKNARSSIATAASAVAEFKEAAAKSVSTLAEHDVATLRAELEAVNAESKAMSQELDDAIAEQLN